MANWIALGVVGGSGIEGRHESWRKARIAPIEVALSWYDQSQQDAKPWPTTTLRKNVHCTSGSPHCLDKILTEKPHD